ncbi:MAG: hypothetical protein GX817_03235 [Elusimicrobia bacterium]|nr:hypothetical protein [Elusimicrobiota bacterium]
MNKTICTFLVAALLIFLPLSGAEAAVTEILDRGVASYLKGDYPPAIKDFERVLEMEDNERARRLLHNSYLEEGELLFNRGRFEEAREYCIRALRLDQESSAAESLLRRAEEKIESEATPEPPPPPAPDPAIKNLQREAAAQRSANTSLRGQISTLRAQRDSLSAELKVLKEKLEESSEDMKAVEDRAHRNTRLLLYVAGGILAIFIALFVSLFIALSRLREVAEDSNIQLEDLDEKFDARIREAEEDTDALEERVARSINTMIDGQREAVKRVSFSASGQAKKDLEAIKDMLEKQFDENTERLLDLLNVQAAALSKEASEKIELTGEGGRDVITDVDMNIRSRADGVEIIPRTVTDSNIAEKMLRPYLKDPSSRVRANALIAIYSYNPDLAMQTLKNMADSSDKWMRLSAAWAAGE